MAGTLQIKAFSNAPQNHLHEMTYICTDLPSICLGHRRENAALRWGGCSSDVNERRQVSDTKRKTTTFAPHTHGKHLQADLASHILVFYTDL